jgi:hypothetical protein
MLPTGLFVVHDTRRGGQDDDSEGTGRHDQSVDPVFDLVKRDVESGGDDTTLVDTTINELDDDLSRSVVIDVFEFVNVATLGRIRTWRFPRFSALRMLFKQSFRTDTRILT